MAMLYFPYSKPDKIYGEIQYSGNLIWGENNQPDISKVSNAIDLLRNKKYWASGFPEGDGITFEVKNKTNTEIFRDMNEAFNFLDIGIIDNPENRKLLFDINELGVFPMPQPGNYYYKLCKIEEKVVKGIKYCTISGPDVFKGEPCSVTILKTELDLINRGVPFQVAIQSVTDREREFLISGIYNTTEEDPFDLEND